MVVLTSNKRQRFYRRYSSAEQAVILAYELEPLPGELWTVTRGPALYQFDVMVVPLHRALRFAESAVGRLEENHAVSMKEAHRDNITLEGYGSFVSGLRATCYLVLGVGAIATIVYALASFG